MNSKKWYFFFWVIVVDTTISVLSFEDFVKLIDGIECLESCILNLLCTGSNICLLIRGCLLGYCACVDDKC